jgi:hypothetical protein
LSKRLLLLPCILIFTGVFLAACGSSGSGDEAEVKEVIEKSATTTDPADCKKLQTQKFMEQISSESGQAAVEECEEEAKKKEGAESVDTSEVEVDGSKATANVALTGGTLNGQAVKVELTKVGDQWKMNEVIKFTHFDQAKLVEYLEGQFKKHSGELPAKLATCFIDAFKEGSQKEVEELVFGGSSEALEEVAEECESSPSA